VAKIDENSYTISEATKLAKVTYWVNDSFDTESGEGFGEGEDIFSPAGTNIKAVPKVYIHSLLNHEHKTIQAPTDNSVSELNHLLL
jgi:hypothetical protein